MTNEIPTQSPTQSPDLPDTLKPGITGSIIVGVVLVVLGFAAIAFPFAATIVAESWIALLLISAGFAKGFYAYQTRGEGGFIWKLLLSLIYIGTGLILWLNPFQGAITLTLVLGSFLLTEGIFETILAFRMRSMPNWGWLLANAIVTFILGAVIWLQLPTSATWVLGTLMGISVISSGVSRIMLAVASHASISSSQPQNSQPQGS